MARTSIFSAATACLRRLLPALRFLLFTLTQQVRLVPTNGSSLPLAE